MNFSLWNNKKYRCWVIGGTVLILTLISLTIRLLPMADLVGTGDMIAGPDAWYNLRLVEVLLASGGYILFEPMTYYPYGWDNVFGPLFTYIAAFFGMFASDTTRIALIDAVSWTPAVLGALMVPVMFFLGKKLGDWKTGLLAGLFIAVIGGQFFARSIYGHFDHHVAETLFSTLFGLCYILALSALRDHDFSWKDVKTWRLPLIFGVLSGASYFLGLLTMTTLVVFGLFAAVMTLIQFILDYKSGKPTEYLVVLNLLTFGIATIGLLIYGIKDFGFSFYSYSLAILIAQILVIIGTFFLYFLAKGISKLEKPWYFYPISILIVAVIGALIFWIVMPDLFNTMIGSLSAFFLNTSSGMATVQEMSSWSIAQAVSSFGWSILLALGGFAVLVWQIIRRESPAALFVLIWSLFMFLATVAHIRWEYFFAVNVALLSAVCVSWAISFAGAEVAKLFGKKQEAVPVQKGKKGKKDVTTASDKPDVLKISVLAVVVIVALVFTGMSAVSAVSTASVYGEAGGTEKDWIEATKWLVDGTPETGIDYYKLYDGEGFSYPSEAYGIMSWWDYGHYITTIGERIPNSNPFQAGVAGEYGAAQVLTATDENAVVEKLNHLGTKYVMTDYQMAGSKFGAMAIWADTELQTTPFYTYLLQRDSTGAYSVVTAQTEDYYNTLTARLQNFDGSYTEAGSVVLVLTDSSAGYGYPVITYTKSYANADDAWKAAKDYNAQSANTAAGKYAYVISVPTQATDYFNPNADVPALKHFRLVHESNTYVIPADSYSYYITEPNGGGTAWVKTFEYVKGAVIKGNGIISIDVTTNNGRTFTYKQVSENGQFIVPYATGQTGEIKTGVYKIEGSGQTFTVSEKAVQNGLTVN